jgi:hypothetical protein
MSSVPTTGGGSYGSGYSALSRFAVTEITPIWQFATRQITRDDEAIVQN